MKHFLAQRKKIFLAIFSLLLITPIKWVSALSIFSLAYAGYMDILEWTANALLQVVTSITLLAGTVLNYVLKFTIVDMKANIASIGVVEVWGVIRDVANMGFIFVLLYAAILTIIGQGQDNKKLIVNVVIAAILINFSLFITNLVIDAANMLALFFYSTMVPASALVKGSDAFTNLGLANSLMDPLKLSSLYLPEGDGLAASQIIIIGIMGSMVALIAAFVFFAVSILFIIRFVVLVFLMILSPIAFVAGVLPGINKHAQQWKDALVGQAFFAPIYFLLTWVVIKLANQLSELPGVTGTMATGIGGIQKYNVDGTLVHQTDPNAISIIVNFGIIIILLITSLVIAKEWANKAGPGVGKLTKWATGAAGSASFGLAGRVGRGTFGAAGSAVSDNEKLKAVAAKGGVAGMGARLTLAAGRKTAGASFDMRGTAIGGSLDAGKAQKGGFTDDLKKAAEKKKKYGESLGPSDITKDETKENLKRLKEREKEIGSEAISTIDASFKKPPALQKLEQQIETAKKMAENPTMSEPGRTAARNRLEQLKANAQPIQKDYETKRQQRIDDLVSTSEIKEKVKTAQEKSDNILGIDDDRAKEIIKNTYDPGKNDGLSFDEYIKKPVGKAHIESVKKGNPGAGSVRKDQYAETLRDSRWIKSNFNPVLFIAKSNKQAAADLRKKKKSVKDTLDDLLKDTGEKTKDGKDTDGEEEKKSGEKKDSRRV